MKQSAGTVEAQPAGCGDSILVTCAKRGRPWRLMVDTGPDECWPMLKARLAQIPVDKAGKRHIDLAGISHIDHSTAAGCRPVLHPARQPPAGYRYSADFRGPLRRGRFYASLTHRPRNPRRGPCSPQTVDEATQ